MNERLLDSSDPILETSQLEAFDVIDSYVYDGFWTPFDSQQNVKSLNGEFIVFGYLGQQQFNEFEIVPEAEMYFIFFNESLIQMEFYNTWFIDDDIAIMTLNFDLEEDFDPDSMKFDIYDNSSELFITKLSRIASETKCETHTTFAFVNKTTNQPVNINTTVKDYKNVEIFFSMNSTNCSIGVESVAGFANDDVLSAFSNKGSLL